MKKAVDLLKEIMFIVCEFVLLKHYRFIIKCFDSFHLVVTRDMSLSVVSEGNKGCGVWVMSSSLPQLLGNYITHNCMYGLAVFCRKDDLSYCDNRFICFGCTDSMH